MSRRTRSATRASTFEAFVADILPVIAGQEKGWVTPADVASIQATCRSANEILQSTTGDEVWQALAKREWPHVDNHLIVNRGNDDDGGGDEDDLPTGKYSTYRELYVNYPRVWLTMEAARIKTLPKWAKAKHMGKKIIECGRCGCNCGIGRKCPGIPIESKFRFDRKERLGYHVSQADVPGGEGV